MSDRAIRLLVVVNVYRPDLGGGVLFADLCEGLAERGMDVTVKCAYPYYPEWSDKSGENGWRIRSTRENGVRVERHGIFIPTNPDSLLQRLLYEASFYLSLRRHLPRRGAHDAVLVICPLVGAVAYAVAAARRLRAPLWLNVQDLSAQAAAAGGIAGRGLAGKLLVAIQNHLFRKADFWSSISEPMVATVGRTTGVRAPVDLIPNWMHRSLGDAIGRHARSMESVPFHEEEHSEKRPARLLYSGNIGSKQDLLSFCRFLHETNIDFELRIQGDGSRASELGMWLSETDDTRFSFRGLTDEDALARALAEADFYLITERRGAGNAFIPSKLIPGLTSGTPVLAICDADSPLGVEMDRFHPGPRIGWSNLSAVESVLQRARMNDDQFREWRANALARSAYFSREIGITRCEEQVRRMLNER